MPVVKERHVNSEFSSRGDKTVADTGSLRAQVANIRNNQPIVNANVKLGGPVNQEQQTDNDGNFQFNDLPPANNYTLDVSATGFQSEHYEDIVVLANNTTNLQKLFLFPED